jgi:hypothetical protein
MRLHQERSSLAYEFAERRVQSVGATLIHDADQNDQRAGDAADKQRGEWYAERLDVGQVRDECEQQGQRSNQPAEHPEAEERKLKLHAAQAAQVQLAVSRILCQLVARRSRLAK